jgi:hypothetical protein
LQTLLLRFCIQISSDHGYRGTQCIALSDFIDPVRLAALSAQCREDEPDVEICLIEIPLARELKGPRDGLHDTGINRAAEVSEDILPEDFR